MGPLGNASVLLRAMGYWQPCHAVPHTLAAATAASDSAGGRRRRRSGCTGWLGPGLRLSACAGGLWSRLRR
ncbi:hypothetical protein CHLRE_03g204212v5 [Chlamydomonas reinhardtii]|uniref:Uncharacterized protein n=1 Tax=Chlamydomonas reinhardtii TaxID=3055 RepID=A0A2K3DZ61_CHLRE|nr:uncharacterized protein CHLRE_03g204212v5 [Chlamydomonas reinhardtii]PNW85815.1 hypothetical protein CHLRE_03g204212v5 [Chlamydomonas reinhardtii]